MTALAHLAGGGPLLVELHGVDVERNINVGGFSGGQKRYLEYHRNSVFLERR